MGIAERILRTILAQRSVRRFAVALVIVGIGAAVGMVKRSQDHSPGGAGMISGPVTAVADGDTITVRAGGGTLERVRLLGINTPEVRDPVECGGPQASAAMKRLASGATVTVIPDATQDRRDRFGRLLGYVEFEGRDLGLEMVRSGLAIAYPFGRPFTRYSEYRQAEREARAARRGSWSHCQLSRR